MIFDSGGRELGGGDGYPSDSDYTVSVSFAWSLSNPPGKYPPATKIRSLFHD